MAPGNRERGRNEIDAVEAWLFRTFGHHLKAEAWREVPDTPAWRGKARGFRARVRRPYCPSMGQKIDLAAICSDALQALPDLLDGQKPRPVADSGPLTLEDIVAEA